MIESLKYFWYWYKVLCVVALILLIFRDDLASIRYEIKQSFILNKTLAVMHVIITLLVLPITIPFSLSNILNKWF